MQPLDGGYYNVYDTLEGCKSILYTQQHMYGTCNAKWMLLYIIKIFYSYLLGADIQVPRWGYLGVPYELNGLMKIGSFSESHADTMIAFF